jgi:hypothetical protein
MSHIHFCSVEFEGFGLLSFYAVSTGSCCQTFQDSLSVPLEMGPIGCPEMMVNNYQQTLH